MGPTGEKPRGVRGADLGKSSSSRGVVKIAANDLLQSTLVGPSKRD